MVFSLIVDKRQHCWLKQLDMHFISFYGYQWLGRDLRRKDEITLRLSLRIGKMTGEYIYITPTSCMKHSTKEDITQAEQLAQCDAQQSWRVIAKNTSLTGRS